MQGLLILWASLVSAKLIAVVEIARHGARVPMEAFEWDSTSWKRKVGELTDDGIAQHYVLGKVLRDRYIVKEKLVSESFDPVQVYVRSTNFQRTIISAYAQLEGLFPDSSAAFFEPAKLPFNESLILAKKGIQSTPVYIYDHSEDYMLLGYSACTILNNFLKDAQKSDYYIGITGFYDSNIRNQVQKGINLTETTFEDGGWIGEALETIAFHGGNITELVDESMYYKLLQFRVYCNSYVFFKDDAVKLASSEMYSEILRLFKGVIDKTIRRKLNIYMTHDTMLIALLKAINNWDGINPPFASTLIFELHEEFGSNFVKILFNDKPIEIRGVCGADCEFDKFQEFVNSWKHSNIIEACRARTYRPVLVNKFYYIKT